MSVFVCLFLSLSLSSSAPSLTFMKNTLSGFYKDKIFAPNVPRPFHLGKEMIARGATDPPGVREGCTNENPEKVWSFAKPPSDPPPGLALKKNSPPLFLLKIAS